jgi:AcrR family transcriptional regulator/DNA-binding XRE family transcriptional regulator
MKIEERRAGILGQRLRAMRLAKGLTQDDVAKRAGFTNTYISKIERGAVALPPSTLSRLGKALRVAPEQFLVDEVDGSVGRAEVSARRGEILNAAVGLFSARGYSRVSIRDLAAKAGCSTANLYHHFSSKYEIFVTLIEGAMDRHFAGLNEALENYNDPVDQLRHVLRNHLLVHMTRPEVRLLSDDFHPMSEPELEVFIEERDRYEYGIRDIVRRGVKAGKLKVDDVAIAVRTALGACNYVDRWFRRQGPLSPEDVADRMTNFLLAGFGVNDRKSAHSKEGR